MTPKDPDPAKLRRDDDDPTPSSSDSESDVWDDGNTPLTDTMDQDRVDKIDSIMQSFCAALDSKLVLVKKEKPPAIKTEEETVKVKEEQDEEDEEQEKQQKEKNESESSQAPQVPTKAFKGLSLLPKLGLNLKKSVAVTPSAPAAPSAGPSAFSGARPRAAIRLVRRASPDAPEPAISAPLAPGDPSPAPPPPPPPQPSRAPAPASVPVPVPASTPTSSSVPAPTPTRALHTPSAQPPPPQITQPSSVGGGSGGGGPPSHALPTILPSNIHLLHNQFFHLPSVPPVSPPTITNPPSRSPPGFGAAAQNLQQTGSRPSISFLGGSQSLRSRLSQNVNVPSVGRFISSSSSRSLPSQEVEHGLQSFGAAPPPSAQWNPAGLFHQGVPGEPQVGSRGFNHEELLSPPNFTEPFHSPPNATFESFSGESLQPPGAPTPGELYPFPAPEPGGSRRQYQFGASPNLGENDSPGYPSRKSSAVSPFAGSASSPAVAQSALDKAPDRDGRRKRQKATDENTPKSGEKKFACPYYKRNRKKYCKWTSCPGPGWEEVHRVKTHLYRRHGRPPQCPRCWAVFATEEALQGHQQQNPPCETSETVSLVEGFSKEQEKKLRSRKKAQPNMTDEDKWRDIYMILFPDDDKDSIPSPYYDESDDGEREEGGGNADTPGGELDDYAAFVRREMPTLVRRELEVLLENESSDMDEKLKPKVAKIVLDLQLKLLNLYKQSQLPLSEYGPQNPGQTAPAQTPGQTPGSNSEPGMASTISPASGADTNPTPGGFDIPYLDPTTFDFDVNNMGAGFSWDGAPAQYQAAPANSDGNFGDGLDWNYEFNQLLNPVLFVPNSNLTQGQGQGQGDLNEWGKRKYDGY